MLPVRWAAAPEMATRSTAANTAAIAWEGDAMLGACKWCFRGVEIEDRSLKIEVQVPKQRRTPQELFIWHMVQ